MFKKKLFLINAHPGGNLGAEAMLTVLLKALYNDSEIASKFDFVIEEVSESAVTQQFLETSNISAAITTFSPRKVFMCYSLEAKAGDVVIDIGGISYQGASIRSNLRNFIRHHFFLRRYVKIFFFTQDFGPPTGILTKFFAKIIMRQAQAIFVRSQRSKVLLESVIGVSPKIIGPYPDVTFRFRCEEEVVPTQKYDLAVVPSAILFNQYEDRYLNALEFVIRNFQDGKKIIILTHNFTSNGSSSDTQVVAMLKSRLSDLEYVDSIEHRMSAIAMKAVIGQASFVVTSRYHALVGALSQSIPAVALGWSHKYEELLGIYGLEDASLPAELWLENANYILRKINELLCGSVVQRLKARNRENIELVDESIESMKTLVLDAYFE